MSKRMNKILRKRAQLITKVKTINPEDRIFLKKEIPHKAYGGILIVVDGKVGERINFATNGLKISREMPIFSQAAELAITDPYVMFYRGEQFKDAEGNPVYNLATAQRKAMIAYDMPAKQIQQEAFFLALTHYTDFEGEVPEIDDEESTSDEERANYGLPPALKRDMHHPLEQKLNHVRYMMLTDDTFAEDFSVAINDAIARVQSEGLMGGTEEEVSEEGFLSEPTD